MTTLKHLAGEAQSLENSSKVQMIVKGTQVVTRDENDSELNACISIKSIIVPSTFHVVSLY